MKSSRDIMSEHQLAREAVWPKSIAEGERLVWITPAFEARSDNPKEDYGIGGCEIYFATRKGDLTVVYRVLTDWYPVHIQETRSDRIGIQPNGAWVNYHSPKALNEYDQKTTDCPFTGGNCYGNGLSSLHGEEIGRNILTQGSKAVWDALEEVLNDLGGQDGA